MAKERFRPWPQKRDSSNRRVIDKDRVKKLYLKAGIYDWTKFCDREGFNPSSRQAQEFPIKAWREEFIDYQSQNHFDTQAERFLDLKSEIVDGRISWSREWRTKVAQIKALRDIWVAGAFQAHQFNQANNAAIVAGTMRPLPVPSISEIGVAALVDSRVMMNEASALLMRTVAQSTVIPLQEKSPEERGEALEDERLQNARVTVLGGGGIPEDKMGEIMARWFDQLNGNQSALPDPSENSQDVQGDDLDEETGGEGGT